MGRTADLDAEILLYANGNDELRWKMELDINAFWNGKKKLADMCDEAQTVWNKYEEAMTQELVSSEVMHSLNTSDGDDITLGIRDNEYH